MITPPPSLPLLESLYSLRTRSEIFLPPCIHTFLFRLPHPLLIFYNSLNPISFSYAYSLDILRFSFSIVRSSVHIGHPSLHILYIFLIIFSLIVLPSLHILSHLFTYCPPFFTYS